MKAFFDIMKNILLITVDCLRKSMLESYNGDPSITPFINSIAKDSLVASDCMSTGNWTPPAVASLLTGSNPYNSGVVSAYDRIKPEVRTLAEILQENGFDTRAIAHNKLLMRELGYSRGFKEYIYSNEAYNQPRMLLSRLYGKYVKDVKNCCEIDTSLMSDWIGKSDRFFYWIHYIDPHMPYLPPSGYAGLSAKEYGIAKNIVKKIWKDLLTEDYQLENKYSTEELDLLRLMYEGSVRQVDESIKKLCQRIESEGLIDDTIIVITSDHGECIGECGAMFHQTSFKQEVLNIPLIIKHGKTRQIKKPCSIVDISASILTLLDIDYKMPDGLNLFYEDYTETMHFVGQIDKKDYFGIRQDRWIAISDAEFTETRLYDLMADPGLLNDLSKDKIDQSNDLSKRLIECYTNYKPSRNIDPVIEKRLRSLGYI